jgi:hypothetical protein
MKDIDFSKCHAVLNSNYNIDKFIDGEKQPRIPFAPGCIFKSVYERLGGLFVECGRVWLSGDIEYLFQEYESGEGWTGYDLLYCRMRFKGPQYVTMIIWDKGTAAIPVQICDNDGADDSAADLKQDQKRIARKLYVLSMPVLYLIHQ